MTTSTRASVLRMAETICCRSHEVKRLQPKSVQLNRFYLLDPDKTLCWTISLLLLLVCVSFTIIGQPRNSILIRRV